MFGFFKKNKVEKCGEPRQGISADIVIRKADNGYIINFINVHTVGPSVYVAVSLEEVYDILKKNEGK